MNILKAYDLYQSYNQAVRECQCSPNTVRSLVTARREGTLDTRGESESRSSLFEPQHLVLVTSLVEESKSQVRADVIHRTSYRHWVLWVRMHNLRDWYARRRLPEPHFG